MSSSRVKTQSKLGPSSAGLLMTPEEFDAVTDYDDRYRYELIHGVLVVTPIPSEAEGDPNEELGYWLRSYRDHHPQGSALNKTLAERYVQLPDSRRRADRVIWAGLGRRPDPKVDHPTIIVEFVSRARRDRTRDYEEKRREYLALGIAEYWVIDRFRRAMTVYRNQPGALAEQVVAEGETYRTDLLPGFELPLARLLLVADEWRK
jgi:Uma2 family endonuclease